MPFEKRRIDKNDAVGRKDGLNVAAGRAVRDKPGMLFIHCRDFLSDIQPSILTEGANISGTVCVSCFKR